MSLSAYVLHHLLTLISFPSHSSPSVTPTCLAICQHIYTTQWSRYLQTAPTKANKQKEHSTVTMPGQLLGGRLAWVHELFFPLVCRLTSFPSCTRYSHFSQLTDLSCEVRYSHSAENYTIFHASISGAILYQFFSWSPLLNGQIPKLHFTSPVTVTSSDSQDLPGIMWVLQTCAGGSRALLLLFRSTYYFILNQKPQSSSTYTFMIFDWEVPQFLLLPLIALAFHLALRPYYREAAK